MKYLKPFTAFLLLGLVSYSFADNIQPVTKDTQGFIFSIRKIKKAMDVSSMGRKSADYKDFHGEFRQIVTVPETDLFILSSSDCDILFKELAEGSGDIKRLKLTCDTNEQTRRDEINLAIQEYIAKK